MLFARDMYSSLLLQGVITVMYSVVVATTLIRRYVDSSSLTRGIKPFIKELVIYGCQRMVGACALIALFTLPAFVVAHLDSVQQAGYVAFSTSLMTMIGALFAPIGLVMVPNASRMINENAIEKLYQSSVLILVWSVITSAIIVVILEVLIHEIIIQFLGSDFFGAIYTVRIVLAGAVPYVIYMTMRSVTEAYKASINAANIILSLGVFILLSFCIWGMNLGQTYIILAFVVSLWLLGLSTLINLRKMWQMSKHAAVSVAS